MGEDEVRLPPSAPAGLGEEDVRRLSDLIHCDYAKIRHIVRAFCASQVDIDGAVAEAIARAAERLSAEQSIQELRARVTTAAVNLGRSELRRQLVRRRQAVLSATDAAAEDARIVTAAMRLDLQFRIRRRRGLDRLPGGEDGRPFKRMVRLTDTSTAIWVRTRPSGRSESYRRLTPGRQPGAGWRLWMPARKATVRRRDLWPRNVRGCSASMPRSTTGSGRAIPMR